MGLIPTFTLTQSQEIILDSPSRGLRHRFASSIQRKLSNAKRLREIQAQISEDDEGDEPDDEGQGPGGRR